MSKVKSVTLARAVDVWTYETKPLAGKCRFSGRPFEFSLTFSTTHVGRAVDIEGIMGWLLEFLEKSITLEEVAIAASSEWRMDVTASTKTASGLLTVVIKYT